MNKKRLLTFLALTVLLSVGAGCTNIQNSAQDSKTQSEKTSVVASFYPLAFLAEEIGGDVTDVENITPTGIDAHDFEPTAKDIAAVTSADVFLFQGADLDPWAERIHEDALENNVTVVEIAEEISLYALSEDEEETDEHSHGQYDPHSWLDPVLMQEEVEIIRDAFIAADPEHSDIYTANAQALSERLEELHNSYMSDLANCTNEEIVVSHDAFGYLARRYNFETVAIAGISPTEEPSARELANISDIVAEHQLEYIFTETLVSDKLAQTIANETGAQILQLHPLEGLTQDEILHGDDYISIMNQNVEQLKLGLNCE